MCLPSRSRKAILPCPAVTHNVIELAELPSIANPTLESTNSLDVRALYRRGRPRLWDHVGRLHAPEALPGKTWWCIISMILTESGRIYMEPALSTTSMQY